MTRLLLLVLLSIPALAMEPDPASMQQKADDAIQAFQLAAQKRLLQIKLTNLDSALKAAPKPDKYKAKALKAELKAGKAELKALDKQLKKDGKKVSRFMKAAKEGAEARQLE